MFNLTFQKENFSDIKYEMQPLLEKHWEEIAIYKEKVPYAPDWERYHQLENSGSLHIVTVRDAGELVGYYVSLISQGLHYRLTKYAINDIVWLKPEYRNAQVGVQLFKYTESLLKEQEGVDVMTVHMKVFLPFDKLCEGLGFDYAERMYTKFIGD